MPQVHGKRTIDRRRVIAGTAALAASLAAPRVVRAETAADFYRGKTVRVLVGSHVAIITHGSDGLTRVASTLQAVRTASGAPALALPTSDGGAAPHVTRVAAIDYLGFASNPDNLAQFGGAVEFRAADISDPSAMTAV